MMGKMNIAVTRITQQKTVHTNKSDSVITLLPRNDGESFLFFCRANFHQLAMTEEGSLHDKKLLLRAAYSVTTHIKKTTQFYHYEFAK